MRESNKLCNTPAPATSRYGGDTEQLRRAARADTRWRRAQGRSSSPFCWGRRARRRAASSMCQSPRSLAALCSQTRLHPSFSATSHSGDTRPGQLDLTESSNRQRTDSLLSPHGAPAAQHLGDAHTLQGRFIWQWQLFARGHPCSADGHCTSGACGCCSLLGRRAPLGSGVRDPRRAFQRRADASRCTAAPGVGGSRGRDTAV